MYIVSTIKPTTSIRLQGTKYKETLLCSLLLQIFQPLLLFPCNSVLNCSIRPEGTKVIPTDGALHVGKICICIIILSTSILIKLRYMYMYTMQCCIVWSV